MKGKPYLVIALMGGVFMFVAAFPHAMGGSGELMDRLLEAEVDPELIGGTLVGWHFGSLSMLTLGSIVVVTCIRLLRGTATPIFPALLAGSMYVLFGAWATLARGVVVHFFGFIAVGLMVLCLGLWKRAQHPESTVQG